MLQWSGRAAWARTAVTATGSKRSAEQRRGWANIVWINALRASKPRSARRLRIRNFFNVIIGLAHGEERFGEAEVRLEPRMLPIQPNSCPASQRIPPLPPRALMQ
jgi:hypothetical protein